MDGGYGRLDATGNYLRAKGGEDATVGNGPVKTFEEGSKFSSKSSDGITEGAGCDPHLG